MTWPRRPDAGEHHPDDRHDQAQAQPRRLQGTARQGPVRRQRLQRGRPARAAAQAGLQGPAEDDQAGRRPVDPTIADAVATAMKDWAIEKGATHFTHLFQPMTGLTAEKHDSFLAPDRRRHGHRRVQRQGTDQGRARRQSRSPPAASAPPSRPAATPPGTRPARRSSWRAPTARRWSSRPRSSRWTGEALDKKTPLLRSMEALSTQALRILKLFGKDASKVFTTVGPEQEYFLIDKNFYYARPDLINAGRTLFGAPPPKGQETGGPVLRLDPRARAGLHGRRRGRAVQARRAGQDAAQRGRPEPVRDRPDLRGLATSPPTTRC